MKHNLFISYKFPPVGDIGTKRQAKFAKYLAKKGHHVHVVTIDYPFQETVSWNKDVKHQNIHIYRLNPCYPLWLLRPIPYSKRVNWNFIKRVIRRLVNTLFYRFDYAQRWQFLAYQKAVSLVERFNIDAIFATGKPFSNLVVGSALKKAFPNIMYVCDIQDRWTHNSKIEGSLLTLANHTILNTVDDIDYYQHRYPSIKNRFSLIPNGFDPEDYQYIKLDKEEVESPLRIIYGGDLADGRDLVLASIISTLDKIDKDDISGLELHIYTHHDISWIRNKYPVAFKKYVFTHPRIPTSEYLKVLAQFPICLSINSAKFPFAIGAKVFDYIGLQKRIWHIASGGEFYKRLNVSEFHVASTHDESSIIAGIQQLATIPTQSSDPNVSDRDYSYVYLTDKLYELLDNEKK